MNGSPVKPLLSEANIRHKREPRPLRTRLLRFEPPKRRIEKNTPEGVFFLYASLGQNLVFKALFGSMSDDKYFLLSKNAFNYHDVVDKITNS